MKILEKMEVMDDLSFDNNLSFNFKFKSTAGEKNLTIFTRVWVEKFIRDRLKWILSVL